MNKRTRLKRAVLRDRRRGLEGTEAPALFGPLSGFDLLTVQRYYSLANTVAHVAALVTDPTAPARVDAYRSQFQQAIDEARHAKH